MLPRCTRLFARISRCQLFPSGRISHSEALLGARRSYSVDVRPTPRSIWDASKPTPSLSNLNTMLFGLEFTNSGSTFFQEVDKQDLQRELRLPGRDLRIIDSSFGSSVSTILVRNTAILVSLMDFRLIVRHDSVLLFDINNTNVRAFVKTLQARIRKTVDVDQDVLPFEFRVLEVLLMTVCDGLYEQLKSLKPELSATMSSLSKRVQQGELELLLQQNHLLRGIESNAIDVRDAIQSFLHSDEDMANAYLTVKAKYGTSRRVDQHHEIELLLENYLKEIVELVDEVQKEREGIKFAQMLINISLDSKRNRIMTTNLLLSLATFSSSICAVSAGYFGMNLHSGMETHPNAFLFISGASALVSATVYLSAVAWWKRRNIL